MGAFSVIPEINEKLLVFLPEKHSHKQSFIWLGPLMKIDEDRVRTYDFKKSGRLYYKKNDFAIIGDLVLEDINKHCLINVCRDDFDKNNASHLILLICDLVFIAALAKKKEISKMLSSVLGTDNYNQSISKYLWVAEKMNMIKKTSKYGDTYYYIPLDVESEYISFAFKASTNSDKKDRARWRVRFVDNIQGNTRKRNALKEVGDD